MNIFIKKKPIAKFVFKHYLTFIGRQEDYKQLIKVRKEKGKREGVYVSKEELLKIVFSIQEDRFRIAALIQYISGARASEILSISKEDVKKVEDIEGIGAKIKITQKGGYERIIFVPTSYSEIILNFINNSSFLYPFLNSNELSLRKLETAYHFYYLSVRKAAELLGYFGFATHDFRRNFIDDAYTELKDIRKVKDVVGHRSINWTFTYLKKKIDETEIVEAVKKLRT